MEPVKRISGYSVETGSWQSEPVMILQDYASGATARIAPGLGSNCVAWSVRHKGDQVEVLETPPGPEQLRDRTFRAGIPVLWPFPGRVRDARYNFNGQEYTLPRTDKGGVHHIHGLVNNNLWRVLETGSNAEGATLLNAIGPEDLSEEQRAGYPFNFSLSLRFSLKGRRLVLDTRLENRETRQEIPFGYGLHPYFRAPLGPEGTVERAACPVLIPAATRWPAEGGLPDGPPQPVAADEDFRQWRPLGPQHFDHVLSGVSYQGEWTTAAYRDPAAGLEVRISADHNFREWVLFTQPNRPSVCIEPYTCPPDAINFDQAGIGDNGLQRLEPGQTWQARVIFEVVDIDPD